MIVTDAGEYGLGEKNTLSRLIELNKPQIDELLLLSVLIIDSESLDERLECTDHITKEDDADHFNDHLEEVLDLCISSYIAVSDGREGSDYPIERCGVQ